MKFLVDVGVGKHVEEWLKKNGYDVKPVRIFNPAARDRNYCPARQRPCQLIGFE